MDEATHMKAIRIHQFGGLEELRYEDAPIPSPAADEILIKVAGTAFNAADVKNPQGLPASLFFPHEFPYIPNIEVSGTVEAAGAEVTDFQPGGQSLCCARYVP
ncbi:alcohol dehydrogenase catalytic domain-containing protein [Paenibacillus rhizoplanae]